MKKKLKKGNAELASVRSGIVIKKHHVREN